MVGARGMELRGYVAIRTSFVAEATQRQADQGRGRPGKARRKRPGSWGELIAELARDTRGVVEACAARRIQVC